MVLEHFQPFFDDKGHLISVMLSAELWRKIEKHVSKPIDDALLSLGGKKAEEELRPEPMKDFEELKACWDFPYPLTHEVHCEQCGAETKDWLQDEPRKFWLKACNLGGQVSYQCLGCKARVTKKHFKKHLTVECKPFIEK